MMQFPRHTRLLGAAIAGGFCFAMVFSSGHSNDRARRLLARDQVQRRVDQVSGRLMDQLRLLQSDAAAAAAVAQGAIRLRPPREITWRYDGTALIAGQRRRAEHELLEQALLRSVPANAANALLGPFPAADGEDYMIGWAAAPSHPGQWGAAAVPLTELLLAAGVKELNSSGLSVRLQSTKDPRVLFQTRSGPMLDPALAHITVGVLGVGGLDWSLAALPAVGWGRPALVGVLLSLLFGAGFGCAAYRWLGQREAMAAERASWRLAQQKLDLRLSEAIRAADSAERRNVAVNDIDVSTGLATRSAFCAALERQLGDVRANPGARIVVAVVLLEPAHVIVAAYGERILASVLAQAAGRIKGITGWSPQVGRVGELELAAWIVLGQSPAEAEQAIAGLATQLAPPYVSESHTVHAPAVIGFSSSADGYAYAEEMVSQAVTVARDSPPGQSGGFHEYEPALRERAITRLQLEDELHKGIANDSLRLYFQPILVSDTRQLVGFEALLRWQHPLEGLLVPARFLPAAVSAGLMLEIDRWVMRQAVMQLRQWNLTAPGQYFLSFNMSPQHFVRPELVAELSDLIDGYEINPQQLHIEIVEQTLINDIQVAVEIARGLRELGAELSLDDFGTGYSSLNYLRTFPVNSLKIDHSFINRMVDDSKDFGVVKTIIDLAHYLGLQCIAEGVESNEQHDLLQMLGPDFCQGFLYSPPVPAEQAQRLMQPSGARLRAQVG
jgi:EAL domain-containing protein (putative c-di-GMP-specific phosphodiesterase class I)/GGDEF domain-containing protein